MKRPGVRPWAALGIAVATMAAAAGIAAGSPASAAPDEAGEPHSAAVPAFPTSPFSLLSKANSEFVTADNAGTSSLLANRTRLGPWEQFALVNNSDGTVSLKANVNGKFVTAENAGKAPLIANRSAVGLWEEFNLAANSDGTFSLQAVVNGLFITTTQAGGTGPLVAANARHTTDQTHFYRAGNPVASILTAQANGTNVTVDPNTHRMSATGNDNTRPSEQLELFDAGDGLVALRSESTKGFVSADTNGNTPLLADRSAIGLWERFTLVNNGDGTISLRALVNNMYVTATGPGNMGPLTASGPAIGPGPNSSQRFTLRGFPTSQNAVLKSNVTAGYVTGDTATPVLTANGISAANEALVMRFSFNSDAAVVLMDPAGGPVVGNVVNGNALVLGRNTGGLQLSFTLVNNTDGTVSLLCRENGRYVGLTTVGASSSALTANSTTIGSTEKFVLTNAA